MRGLVCVLGGRQSGKTTYLGLELSKQARERRVLVVLPCMEKAPYFRELDCTVKPAAHYEPNAQEPYDVVAFDDAHDLPPRLWTTAAQLARQGVPCYVAGTPGIAPSAEPPPLRESYAKLLQQADKTVKLSASL
jgi:hypothetical protein